MKGFDIMAVSLNQLHLLLDNINPTEYDIVSKILLMFVAETEPLPDEVEAIRKLDAAIANNELYDESSINWD